MKKKITWVIGLVLVCPSRSSKFSGATGKRPRGRGYAGTDCRIQGQAAGKTNDYSMQMLGHTNNDDFSYVGEAYAKAYEEGKKACDDWMVGKSVKVKAAAIVYCSMWRSTLQANAEADANYEDFASTPAGAQFVRAQAELEAAADE